MGEGSPTRIDKKNIAYPNSHLSNLDLAQPHLRFVATPPPEFSAKTPPASRGKVAAPGPAAGPGLRAAERALGHLPQGAGMRGIRGISCASCAERAEKKKSEVAGETGWKATLFCFVCFFWFVFSLFCCLFFSVCCCFLFCFFWPRGSDRPGAFNGRPDPAALDTPGNRWLGPGLKTRSCL